MCFLYTSDPASDFEIERNADNSPLTIADRKAHEAIVAILNEDVYKRQFYSWIR